MKFNVHRSPDQKVGEVEIRAGEIIANLPDAELESDIEGLETLGQYNAAEPPRKTDTPAERKEPATMGFIRNYVSGVLSTQGLSLKSE